MYLVKPSCFQAEELKAAGNQAYTDGKFGEAIDLYQKAINADKISMEDKAKCYGNMSQTYILWQSKFEEALKAGKKSIECSIKGGNYPKAFVKTSTAHVKLNQPELAALTLKKGLALAFYDKDKNTLRKEYDAIE